MTKITYPCFGTDGGTCTITKPDATFELSIGTIHACLGADCGILHISNPEITLDFKN